MTTLPDIAATQGNVTMTPEAQARQEIDAQLTACGWVVQDFKSVDFSAGRGIALREVPLKTGPCDYLLLVDRKALGVVEAKKEGTTLSTVAEQSTRYATSLPDFLAAGLTGPLPFLYESTGVETFFRDERDPDPRSRRVFSFHRPETLAEWFAEPNTLRRRLAQMPKAHPLVTLGMRDCQIEAITGLEKSFAEDRPRALIHMATGAGKTFTACAFTYRLIKYAKARRVLFLVDRANLGEQARDEFARFKTPDTGRLFTELYNVQHLTSPHIDDVCRVTICTIQRLYSILRGEELAEDADELSGAELAKALGNRTRDVAYNATVPIEKFDFIVTDECHRSIYNLWRQVLEYFDASLIGLTATPAPQTIAYFHQNRVAEYNHERAVTDGVNVGYDVYRIKTKVTDAGGKVDKGFLVDHRSKASRKARQEVLADDLDYTLEDLDRSAKAKAAGLVQAFRDYLVANQAQIDALQILYSRPFKQRLTEPMLKELEKKLRDNHAAWTEDNLWNAFAAAKPGKVKGRSQVGRFADLVSLVRFSLEQQPILKPFAESVAERFNEWLMDKAKAGVKFSADQLAWLNLIRDHIATSLSIEPEDLDLTPFNQRGGLGKAHQLFGEQLPKLLDELNTVLAA